MTTIRRYHGSSPGGGGPSLFPVQSTFFCGPLLCPDYKQRWAKLLASTIRPGLASGALMGLHFGDELCWACTPWSNLSAAVDAARADLPRGTAILTYNEAYPVFIVGEPNGYRNEGGLWQWSCDTANGAHPRRAAPGMANVSYPSVPAGLDWLSLDYYPSEGTVEGTIKLFQERVYPKMAEHQKILFVPPGYGSNTLASRNALCCKNVTRDGANPPCDGNCTAAMLHWAQGIYAWARSDSRVVGLNIWHYESAAAAGEYEPGLTGLPAVLRAWQAIGKEIRSGAQRDLDWNTLEPLGPAPALDPAATAASRQAAPQRWRQDVFAISEWQAPWAAGSGAAWAADAAARYDELAGANFSVVLGGLNPPQLSAGCNCTAGTEPCCDHTAALKLQAQLCEKHGLKAVPSAGYIGGIKPGQPAPIVQPMDSSMTKSPVFWGLGLKDEPKASEFGTLANISQQVAAQLPGALRFINLLPDYATPKQLNATDYKDYVDTFVRTVKPDIVRALPCLILQARVFSR